MIYLTDANYVIVDVLDNINQYNEKYNDTLSDVIMLPIRGRCFLDQCVHPEGLGYIIDLSKGYIQFDHPIFNSIILYKREKSIEHLLN